MPHFGGALSSKKGIDFTILDFGGALSAKKGFTTSLETGLVILGFPEQSDFTLTRHPQKRVQRSELVDKTNHGLGDLRILNCS